MTAPRQVLPGGIYLITRRCTQRELLLRPDAKTNEIFEYCLAESAQRHGMELINWLAMSNHYHAVVFDPRGVLPAFLERFHKLVAHALNARWGRRENLWSSEQTSAVRLDALDDVAEKVVYTLTNPVADHLVDRASDWPGASGLRCMAGRPVVVRRPLHFFCKDGPMPAQVELVAKPPPYWSGGVDEWAERVRAALRVQEETAREQRLRRAGRVVGRKRILAMSHRDRATSVEPPTDLRPHIAARSFERRVASLAALQEFRRAYAVALRRFMSGQRDTVFPAGTYRMRLLGALYAAPS